MTTKFKLILLGSILTLGFAYVATHSDTFVSSVYEKAIVKGCGVDLMCRLGGGLIEAPVVACMEDKTISWSQTALETCLKQVTATIKGE